MKIVYLLEYCYFNNCILFVNVIYLIFLVKPLSKVIHAGIGHQGSFLEYF